MLRKQGYDGWLIFEHEKRWHPELPEPDEIFPQFMDWIRWLWGTGLLAPPPTGPWQPTRPSRWTPA